MSYESTFPGHTSDRPQKLAHEPTEPSGLFAPRPRTVRPGEIVDGRYRVIRRLAKGGMSRVYLAEQTNIQRQVALKIIRAQYARDRVIASRLRREARALAAVDHPNIVTVHDLGEAPTGEPYIVMELVEGPSLADLVRQEGPLQAERALALLLQIARALAAVHVHGIIHRDLKPDNVLLHVTDSGVEVAKVSDFGLAKVIEDRAALETFHTRAGTVLGTPEYMAPEQVRGGEVDHRADIYSFGCMTVELLTGSPPYAGDALAVLYKHVHDDPPTLASRGVIGPAGIESVIRRCMARSPAARYPDAVALYRALLDVAQQNGISKQRLRIVETLHDDVAYAAVQEPATTTPQRPRRLERALAIALGMVLAALAGVLAARAMADPPAQAAASGPLLIVTTSPPGAEVFVDDVDLGVTPLATHGITAGSHVVQLRRAGYDPVERKIAVNATGGAEVEVQLPAPSRRVAVTTVPAGATLFLDGSPLQGQTPTEIQVEADEFYQLRAEKDGFAPGIVDLTPDDHAETLEIPLEPAHRDIGYLWIDSNHIADVYIDGAPTGLTTPTFGIDLPIGAHEVQLRDSSGAHSRPLHVTLARGQHQHLRLNLLPEKKR